MATAEGLVFDGLALNDFTNFRIQEFDPGIPPKRWQWISGDDADGAVLPEEAHFDNAEMTLRIRIMPQASMDAALAKIGQIVDKLQECEQQPLGLAVVWTPAGSTKTLTAYILGGEISGIPITTSGEDQGWFLRNPAPVVNLKLYRRPFLYGTEVTSAATLTDTNPAQILTVAGVTGDVPAEARLVVTDAATQSRRHIEWGLEWRYYNAATSLIVESDNLVTSGFAGVGATRANAYDPGAAGNNVVRATLANAVQAVCGTGVLAHVGNYRVKARVWTVAANASTDVNVRLSYQEGDGPFRSNAWTQPVANNAFAEVDLGIINIPEKILGTQKWLGRIEAYSATIGDTLDIDYLLLIPVAEGYGKARAAYTYSPGVLVARDEFAAITAGTVLNARVAPLGGTWATSGIATDFAAADAPGAEETETRATADAAGGNPRWAILGATNYTDTEAGVWFQVTSNPNIGSQQRGVAVRWVDASNQLFLRSMRSSLGGLPNYLQLESVTAGSASNFVQVGFAPTLNAWYQLRVVCYATGVAHGWLLDAGGAVLQYLTMRDSALATGGVLATGKPGFFDQGRDTSARYFKNFYAATPTAEQFAIYSGRSAEIRSDGVIRQDSTGTYYGPVSSYRGAHFYLPPAGDEARTSRILAKARRADVDTADDNFVVDSTTVTVSYTPRYSTVPR